MTVPTKRDAKVIRGVIQRMKEGPAFRCPSDMKLSPAERHQIEDAVQERVTEWCRLWFIAELDALLPDEEKAR